MSSSNFNSSSSGVINPYKSGGIEVSSTGDSQRSIDKTSDKERFKNPARYVIKTDN